MLMRPFFCCLSVAVLAACGGSEEKKGGDTIQDKDRGDTGVTDTGEPPPDPADTGDPEPDTGSEDVTPPADPIGDNAASAAALGTIEHWNWDSPLAFDAIDHGADVDVYSLSIEVGTIVFLAVESLDDVDLQLRLFDAEDRALGVSSVMPNRAWGDDPGIWIQARFAGTIYVEVSAETVPTDAARYRLWGTQVEGEDGEPNDTTSDADSRLDEGSAGFRSSLVAPDEQTEFLGMMHSSEDVDIWAFHAPETGAMSWSLWPVGSSSLDPSVILYDASFNPIAWADDSSYAGTGIWYDDVGILYPVVGGQRYYLSVSNNRPSSGPGTMYVGAQSMLTGLDAETEPNDTLTTPYWASLSESDTHPGYAHWTVHGAVNQPDETDVVAFSAEQTGGQYVSVHLQTGTIGSGLRARVTVYGDSEGSLALGTAAADPSGDVSLKDVWIPDDTAEGAYVEITALSRAEESTGNQYFLGVESYPVPLHD